MFRNKICRRGIAIVLLLATLTGCGNIQNSGTQSGTNGARDGLQYMETAPVLDYEVPNVVPGILLNQLGYKPDSLKTVVVQGAELPEEFRIVDAATGETVYTGVLEEQGHDKSLDEYTGYGDFSDFSTEGTYYMECDVLGLSYEFVIKETLQEELMAEALQHLVAKRPNMTKQHIQDVSVGMSTLLLSYELYGTVYDRLDETLTVPVMISEVKNYMEWLRGQFDAESGVVMDGETVLATETAWAAAVLAKFSYTYQKYDSVYATACLQAADKAWSYLDKNKADVEAELLFYVACELYRATGRYQYRLSAENLGKTLEVDVNNEAQLFGMLTFGFTKRKVNVELCDTLLGTVFDEAEIIAQEDKEGYFVTEGTLTPKGLNDFLWDMVILAAVDYVITNSEYATLMERNHSYLAGENVEAVCYVDSTLSDTLANCNVSVSCEFLAGYLLMLSEIMSHEQEENK